MHPDALRGSNISQGVNVNWLERMAWAGSTAGETTDDLVDAFLSRVSATGDLVEQRRLSTPPESLPTDLAVDADGNRLLAGRFGTGTVIDVGPQGAVLWNRGVGTLARAVAVDPAGFVYAAVEGDPFDPFAIPWRGTW